MFDQVLDDLRKATDSTMQLQQEMFRQWFEQWPRVLGIATPGDHTREQLGRSGLRLPEGVVRDRHRHAEQAP